MRLVSSPIIDYYTREYIDNQFSTVSGSIITYVDQRDNSVIAYVNSVSGSLVTYVDARYASLYDQIVSTSGNIISYVDQRDNYLLGNITTTSGDIINWVVGRDYVTAAQLTTTSGDIVSQIGAGGVTLEQLTTTSGDIVAQIGESSATTLSGIGGINTALNGGIWYIDPYGATIPVATVSGVSISGTGGMVCTFYPTTSGEGYWLIDGSNFSAGINLEYTTVMGTAGSGNGIFWGEAQFTGLTGTSIYHGLGNVDHSVLITPSDTTDFDQTSSAMIGEVYVKKFSDYDTVYTTGSGSLGQKFSWMVVQGWPYPIENKSNLWVPLSITPTSSGSVFGAGQDTGLQITVSGAGSYILMYTVGVQVNSSVGSSYGYVWLEDNYYVVPKSHSRIGSSGSLFNGVYQHVTNSVHIDQSHTRTYRLCAAKDNVQTPTSMYLSGGVTFSGGAQAETSSNLMLVPVALMGQSSGTSGGSGGGTTLIGAGGIATDYQEDTGVWVVDGSSVIGPGGIMYTVGSGAGISYGFATFSGMDGSKIYHNLGGHIHSTIITPGYPLDTPPSVEDISAVGNIYVVNGPNEDTVYNTGNAGLAFSWVSSRGLPYYSSIADHLDEIYTVTASSVQPTFGQGQDIGLSFSLPPGAWNLCYNLSYSMDSEATGKDRAWVWVETATGILNRSVKELSVWSPLQSSVVQHASHMIQITPSLSSDYTLKISKDSNFLPDNLYVLGNTTSSGSSSSFIAIPAYANGYFGSQPVTSSGSPQSQLIGSNYIQTDFDIETNTWNVEGTSVSGTRGITVSLQDRTWVVDGSGLIVSTSGIWMQGSDNHLSSTVPITSSVTQPTYQAGQDTGLHIDVTPGNWAIVYSVSYQMDSEATGPIGGFTWLEDGYSLVNNSELKLHSFAPMMSPTVLNATSVINYTTQYPVTLKLCAAKNSALPPDNFYLLDGPTASGSNCNIALIPSATLSGSTDPLLFTISGVGGVTASYANGEWTIDATYLQNLRNAWDSVYSGVYSTAKTGSIVYTITVTSGVVSATGGAGSDTGLNVTVGSGTWNIWWQTSYKLLSDVAGQYSGYTWLENDTMQVVSGSVSYVSTFAPIESSIRKSISNMVTVSTETPVNYRICAAKDLNYLAEYFYIYGGSAAEPGSKITAWSPEVYASSIDLGVNNITNNNTFTTQNIDSRVYNSVSGIDNLSSTTDGVQITGLLTVTGTHGTSTKVDDQGVTWPNEPRILGLSNLVKTINGGRLDLVSASQIDWNPVQHNVIGLYNGSAWELVSPSGTVSLLSSLVQTTISGTAITYDVNYDVYANYLSSDNFSLVVQDWATSSGGGARFSPPTRFQGVLVYDLTADGVKRRYLGTIRLYNTGGGVAGYADQKDKRFIMNYYNKVRKTFGKNNPYSSNTSIASSTSAWRRWNNSATDWFIEFLSDGINATRLTSNLYLENGTWRMHAFSIDSLTTLAPECMVPRGTGADNVSCVWTYTSSEGYHYVYPISRAAGNNEYYWYSSGSDQIYSNVDGEILC
jgi:hypothetical protein